MNGKFNERGDKYVLNDKETKFPLYNYHFNKEYYTTIANDLSGDGMCFYPDKKIYTRGERFVLVKDGDEVWWLRGRTKGVETPSHEDSGSVGSREEGRSA